MLAVTHGADSGLAGSENLAGFAGRQFDDSIVPFAGDELGESAGRTCHEGALAGTKFDAVDKGTDGDGAQGKSVSYFGSGISAAEERRTYLEAVGGDDVGLDAVNVVEKGDAGRPVGVVLDALYYCGDSVEISLKVYDTVFALVSATKVTGGEMAFVVATAGGAHTDCKRFFRCCSSDCTFEYTDNFVTLPGGCGLEFSYCHCCLDVAEEFDGLSVSHCYVGFLPAGGLAFEQAALSPARFVLTAHYGGIDAFHLHTVNVLNKRLDLVLVGVGGHAESVAIALFGKLGCPFGDDWFDCYVHSFFLRGA